jgi:ABC-type cobalamin transport system ATPase subunit
VRVLGEIEHLAGRGMAVTLSTHGRDHAFLFAHQVALLHQGRLAGRVARVCVPATARGARPGRPS